MDYSKKELVKLILFCFERLILDLLRINKKIDVAGKLIECGVDAKTSASIGDTCNRISASDDVKTRVIQCCARGKVSLHDLYVFLEDAPGLVNDPPLARSKAANDGLLWGDFVGLLAK